MQLVAPLALGVGEFAFYRAWAQADPIMQTPMKITVTRLSGSVTVFVSTDPYPGPDSYWQNATMGERNYAIVVVPWNMLPQYGQYIFIGVRGEGPDQSTYTITAATSATVLTAGQETYGFCAPADANRAAIDGMFIFRLGNEAHPVVATANYIDPPGSQLQLLVMDSAMNFSDAAYPWTFPLSYNQSAYISRWDPALRQCVSNRPQAGCSLYFNVTGCTQPTVFSLVTQLGDTPVDLTDDDSFAGTLYNNASIGFKDNQRFRIGVSSPSQLAIYVEQCVGGVSAYLNYPQTGSFPTNSSNNQAARSTSSLLQFNLGTGVLQQDSVYYVTVEAETEGESKYLLVSNTIVNITLPVIALQSLNCQPDVNSLTFTFQPRLTVASSDVLYQVYYVEHAESNNAALFTRCGVNQPGVNLYKSWTQAEVATITNTANGLASFTVNETDVTPHLNSSVTYRWSILVVYANNDPGFASYSPITQRPLAPQPPPSEPSKIAEDAGAIVLGIVLPLTLILAGVALYLYIRNRKLRQELSVELPDVSATPSSAAARRRAQRGPDVQTDSFSRGGGDMYNSLLGEDEQAGGDDSAARRKARAQRTKATTSTTGSSDLPEDSDVAYRSDVI